MSGSSDPSPGTSDWPAVPELWKEKVSALTGDHVIVTTTYINVAPSWSDFYFTFKLLEGISQSLLWNKFKRYLLLHPWVPHSINELEE